MGFDWSVLVVICFTQAVLFFVGFVFLLRFHELFLVGMCFYLFCLSCIVLSLVSLILFTFAYSHQFHFVLEGFNCISNKDLIRKPEGSGPADSKTIFH